MNKLLLSFIGASFLTSSAWSYPGVVLLDAEPSASRGEMPEDFYGIEAVPYNDCDMETLVCNRELLEEFMSIVSVVADDQDRYNNLKNGYCMTSQTEINCKPNERIAAYTGEAYYENKISGGQCLFRMNGKDSIPFYRVCEEEEN